jgi:hypothetical protein
MVDIPRDIDIVVNALTPWVVGKPWAQTAGLNPDQSTNLLEGRETVLRVVQEMRDKILHLDLSTRQGTNPSVEEMLAVEWQILGSYVASFVVYFAHEEDRYNREHRDIYLQVVNVISEIMTNYGLCWMAEALAKVKTVYLMPDNRLNNNLTSWIWIDRLLIEINDEIFLNLCYPVLSEERLNQALALTQTQGEVFLHMALLGIKRYLVQAGPILESGYGSDPMDQLVKAESGGAFILRVCADMAGYEMIEVNKIFFALSHMRLAEESRNQYLAKRAE